MSTMRLIAIHGCIVKAKENFITNAILTHRDPEQKSRHWTSIIEPNLMYVCDSQEYTAVYNSAKGEIRKITEASKPLVDAGETVIATPALVDKWIDRLLLLLYREFEVKADNYADYMD